MLHAVKNFISNSIKFTLRLLQRSVQYIYLLQKQNKKDNWNVKIANVIRKICLFLWWILKVLYFIVRVTSIFTKYFTRSWWTRLRRWCLKKKKLWRPDLFIITPHVRHRRELQARVGLNYFASFIATSNPFWRHTNWEHN